MHVRIPFITYIVDSGAFQVALLLLYAYYIKKVSEYRLLPSFLNISLQNAGAPQLSLCFSTRSLLKTRVLQSVPISFSQLSQELSQPSCQDNLWRHSSLHYTQRDMAIFFVLSYFSRILVRSPSSSSLESHISSTLLRNNKKRQTSDYL